MNSLFNIVISITSAILLGCLFVMFMLTLLVKGDPEEEDKSINLVVLFVLFVIGLSTFSMIMNIIFLFKI